MTTETDQTLTRQWVPLDDPEADLDQQDVMSYVQQAIQTGVFVHSNTQRTIATIVGIPLEARSVKGQKELLVEFLENDLGRTTALVTKASKYVTLGWFGVKAPSGIRITGFNFQI